ncbi:MAG: choice-of-anchor Q domain-containing protein [bacterium]
MRRNLRNSMTLLVLATATATAAAATCPLLASSGCGSESSYDFPAPPSACEAPEPRPAFGTGVTVGSGTPESCTEEALATALDEGGNVGFDCGTGDATIVVTQELAASTDAILDGDGRITLDGGGATRILHTEARVYLTVRGITFVRGNATTSPEAASGGAIRVGWLGLLGVFDCAFYDNLAADDGIEGGGAIYQSNGGELVVVRSTFERNAAISGGAIDNLLSPMTIVDSTFRDNESTAGGGAVYDDGASAYIDDGVSGTISICGSHFENNRSIGTGGAVYLWAYAPDELVINRCSFVGNTAVRPADGDGSALGGALRTGNAPLLLANSLFAENHADVHGGAYWTRGNYPTKIINCTFYRNNAGVPGEEGGYGGALSGFNLEMRNLTFVENHAEFTGGAVSNEENRHTLNNSIFLHNTSSNQWGLSQTCTGTMPGANNIQWPAPGSDGDPPCSADVLLADPLLGELSDNGGGTDTIPLLPGSPALDGASDCLDTDQRAEPRQGTCDIGAYEAQ